MIEDETLLSGFASQRKQQIQHWKLYNALGLNHLKGSAGRPIGPLATRRFPPPVLSGLILDEIGDGSCHRSWAGPPLPLPRRRSSEGDQGTARARWRDQTGNARRSDERAGLAALARSGRYRTSSACAVRGAKTLILDGGTTVLALARLFRPERGRMVITPSPWIAVVFQENGIEVTLIGGQISTRGGICVGMIRRHSLAPWPVVLGACGLEGTFGLSADDLLESAVKRAMARCAKEVAVLADSSKIGMRAHHKILAPRAITHLVTDASEHEVTAFRDACIDIHHV